MPSEEFWNKWDDIVDGYDEFMHRPRPAWLLVVLLAIYALLVSFPAGLDCLRLSR